MLICGSLTHVDETLPTGAGRTGNTGSKLTQILALDLKVNLALISSVEF